MKRSARGSPPTPRQGCSQPPLKRRRLRRGEHVRTRLPFKTPGFQDSRTRIAKTRRLTSKRTNNTEPLTPPPLADRTAGQRPSPGRLCRWCGKCSSAQKAAIPMSFLRMGMAQSPAGCTHCDKININLSLKNTSLTLIGGRSSFSQYQLTPSGLPHAHSVSPAPSTLTIRCCRFL